MNSFSGNSTSILSHRHSVYDNPGVRKLLAAAFATNICLNLRFSASEKARSWHENFLKRLRLVASGFPSLKPPLRRSWGEVDLGKLLIFVTASRILWAFENSTSLKGHIRVTLCLCFKTSLCKTFLTRISLICDKMSL